MDLIAENTIIGSETMKNFRLGLIATLDGLMLKVEESEKLWLDLTREVIHLPLHYVPAVIQVVCQGRWREASNPAAYNSTVV